MRAYTFTNWLLRTIQQGIQPAHCLVDMFWKYKDPTTIEYRLLYDWAENHKTMICKSAGDADGVRFVWEELRRLGPALNLPFQKFHEDKRSLDGAMTSVGIIVPTMLWTYADMARASREPFNPLIDTLTEAGINPHVVTSEFVELANLLNACQLAT